MGDAAQEQAAHRDMDDGLGYIETLLEVPDEAAPTHEPTEGSLADPPAWPHLEAGLGVNPAHDLDDEVEKHREAAP